MIIVRLFVRSKITKKCKEYLFEQGSIEFFIKTPKRDLYCQTERMRIDYINKFV